MKNVPLNHHCTFIKQKQFINETPEDLRTEEVFHCRVCKRDVSQAELDFEYVMKTDSRAAAILQHVLGDSLEK